MPAHLRGTGYASADKLGSGVGYLYPHSFPEHWVEQSYWPEQVEPRVYYEGETPAQTGNENGPEQDDSGSDRADQGGQESSPERMQKP